MIKKYIVMMAALFFYMNSHASSAGDIFQKPVIYVSANISGCVYDVRVNDVPVIFDDRGVPVNTQGVPVNPWLISSVNKISVMLSPLQGASMHKNAVEKDCEANVRLFLRNHDGAGPEVLLTTINYHSDSNNINMSKERVSMSSLAGKYSVKSGHLVGATSGNIVVGNLILDKYHGQHVVGVTVSRDITMPVSFPRWQWLKGEVIEDNKHTKDELISLYKSVWHAVHSHDVSSILPMFNLRNKEYGEAYYETAKFMQNTVDLKGLSTNKDLALVPFTPRLMQLKIYGNGRLAELVYPQHRTSIIVLNYKDGSAYVTAPIFFSKIKDQWVIVR